MGRFTGLQPTAVLRPVQPTWLGATPSSLGTPCTASAFTAPRHASRVRPRASGQAQPSCPPADDGQVDGIHPRSPNDLRSETAQADIASPYVQFVPVPRVSQWPAHDGTRLQIEARLAENHRPNWQADVPSQLDRQLALRRRQLPDARRFPDVLEEDACKRVRKLYAWHYALSS